MTGLPDIKLDSPLPISFADMREELEQNLTSSDAKLISYFFMENDCKNLVKLLKDPEAQIDALGNLTMEQLQDLITSALESEFNAPEYPAFMSEFVRDYDGNKDKQNWFAEDAILYAYYSHAKQCKNGMMRKWFELNLDITNILTALTARKYGWNVADYIQGDNEVTEMIRQHNSKDFDLSNEYDYVKELMQIADSEDPVEKEKRIDALKWAWLEDQTFFDSFSLDAVFAYLCKLNMLTRWENLDAEKGQETFKQIIEDLRSECKVPEQFIIKSPLQQNK